MALSEFDHDVSACLEKMDEMYEKASFVSLFVIFRRFLSLEFIYGQIIAKIISYHQNILKAFHPYSSIFGTLTQRHF